CFFFFQAEDGIRDRTVTGVQTCALPIFELGRGERCGRRKPGEEALEIRDDGVDAGLLEHDLADPHGVGLARAAPGQVAGSARERSEERRVGKEWRARWARGYCRIGEGE